MKTFRIVAGILTVIPLGLLTYHLSFETTTYDPNSVIEYVYLVLGVPILILNYWVWFESEMIEYYLSWKEKK